MKTIPLVSCRTRALAASIRCLAVTPPVGVHSPMQLFFIFLSFSLLLSPSLSLLPAPLSFSRSISFSGWTYITPLMPLGVDALSRPLAERCSLCRFMTILYYLVDTEEGGMLFIVLERLYVYIHIFVELWAWEDRAVDKIRQETGWKWATLVLLIAQISRSPRRRNHLSSGRHVSRGLPEVAAVLPPGCFVRVTSLAFQTVPLLSRDSWMSLHPLVQLCACPYTSLYTGLHTINWLYMHLSHGTDPELQAWACCTCETRQGCDVVQPSGTFILRDDRDFA